MNRTRATITALLSVLAASAAGCTIGDGRGDASIEGLLTVTFEANGATDAKGRAITVETVSVLVGALQLDATTPLPGGNVEQRTTVLPLGAQLAPTEGVTTLKFGPFEVVRGDYQRLSVVLSELRVVGQVDGSRFEVLIAPPGGIPVSAGVDLPINRSEPPQITATAALALPGDLFADVDLAADGAVVAAGLAAAVAARGALTATWERRQD